MDASALLAQIAQALNSQDADFDGIMAQVVQLALTGQEVYLLVDDAERLTGAAVGPCCVWLRGHLKRARTSFCLASLRWPGDLKP